MTLQSTLLPASNLASRSKTTKKTTDPPSSSATGFPRCAIHHNPFRCLTRNNAAITIQHTSMRPPVLLDVVVVVFPPASQHAVLDWTRRQVCEPTLGILPPLSRTLPVRRHDERKKTEKAAIFSTHSVAVRLPILYKCRILNLPNSGLKEVKVVVRTSRCRCRENKKYSNARYNDAANNIKANKWVFGSSPCR